MSAATQQPGRSLSESYLLEASAGTGKTTQLVQRIVDVLAAGARIDRIAAVTFTNAAAGEMKIRVRDELEKARANATGEQEQNLRAAVEGLERAFIGTIHAFAKHLLRRRPVEACLDPDFREMDEGASRRLFASVFRPWLDERLAAGSPALLRAFRRVEEWRNEPDPVRKLMNAAWDLAEWRDFPTPWRTPEYDRSAELRKLIAAAAEFSASRPNIARSDLRVLPELVERFRRAEALGQDPWDAAEAELLQLPQYFRWKDRCLAIPELQVMLADIEAFERVANADLAAALRDELWQAVELYEQAKSRAGLLDFMDLLVKARDLLHNREVRQYFQNSWDCIFIDEFQDTDPLQAEILLLLCACDAASDDWRSTTPKPGKLFVVGDPKQSIYRFRRADVTLYRKLRESFDTCGVQVEGLHSSPRSVESIQTFVNSAFASSLPDYAQLTGGRPDALGQPAVVALPMPNPIGGNGTFAKKAIEGCAPAATAAFINWLVQHSGWRVSERDGTYRAIRPSDVCILFRRFTRYNEDLSHEYVRALEARGLPHVVVGSKSFHAREEVAHVRTALHAVESPGDELRVFATLRNHFAILDRTLFAFHQKHGRLHPFRSFSDDLEPEFEPVRDALAFLAELHRERNGRPLADTVARLLERTRAHAAFAFRKGGERVLANVYRLLDLARSFESSALSFRGFLDYLDEQAEMTENSDAPVVEPNAPGVKLMTVHKAKGLEFPVVILADLTARLYDPDRSNRFVDPDRRLCAQSLAGWAPLDLLENRAAEIALDRDEALRLAYVAATRARDVLVVSAVSEPGFLDHPLGQEGWLAPLYPALYQRGAAHWFDRSLLDADQHKPLGIAHEQVLKGNAVEGVRRFRAWQERRQAVVEAAARPHFRVERASDTHASVEAAPVEVIELLQEGMRPAGRRFGKLVHAVLEAAIPQPEVERTTRALGRRLRATEQEVRSAAAAVEQVLAHPVMRAAAEAQEVHRELPLLLRLDDGKLVEGRVDLAFRSGEAWTLVDFKTGAGGSARDRRQLGVYAAAFARASRGPVRAVILEV